MTIGEAAQVTGVSVDNLRYYERIGIIPEIPRLPSGVRDYDQTSLQWIEIAMRFKQAGMSLEAIREYIRLAFEGENTRPARKEILTETKRNLENKISELQENLDVINYKLDHYDSQCDLVTMEVIWNWKEQNSKQNRD